MITKRKESVETRHDIVKRQEADSVCLSGKFSDDCFTYIFFNSLSSVVVFFQAQDFYVEMKWEFTSWGDLSLCIPKSSNQFNYKMFPQLF